LPPAAGDTLVVTKLDRLAQSLSDARAVADDLTQREVKLNLGGSVHDILHASDIACPAP
jgi:DNA invertase Pin-like site-specific DNA recombinase